MLVVDDETEVQALLQTALTSWGYSVLGVTSPSEAIRLAEHHPVPIDLLVTDMVMPEMNGAVLAERLVAMHPAMATLFMSGYGDYSAESIAHSRARTGFLQKPFAPDAVARKVRDLLDSAGAIAPGTAASHLRDRGPLPVRRQPGDSRSASADRAQRPTAAGPSPRRRLVRLRYHWLHRPKNPLAQGLNLYEWFDSY